MPSNPFDAFCDQVCSVIRQPLAKRLAREELTAHLEDHAAALEEQGVPPEEAALRAVEAMGDPYQIGHQLNRCHNSMFPGLTTLLTVVGVMLILISIVSSSLLHTGLFSHSSLLPPACTLPFQENETPVISGTASGGGTVGGYRVTAQDAALIRTPEYPDDPSHLELQVTLSSSHWQPWLDNLDLYEVPGTWIDSTGATGTTYCFSWLDSPLTGTGYLEIKDPTPGAQWFTVTLGRPGDQIYLQIVLDQEVPES